jgi:predicted Fe-Mo cluster-binding NifX family protein
LKAAFATWNNRIAPVFDTVEQLYILEIKSGRIDSEHLEWFKTDTLIQKVLRLVELGIDTVVCGAISKPVYGMLVAQGIKVVDFVAGDLYQVINAWLNGSIIDSSFAMPGKCSRKTETKPYRHI